MYTGCSKTTCKDTRAAQVSDMKAVNRGLRKPEVRRADHFELLFESAPDAIVVARADGRIALVNERTQEMFGYARDELIDQPVGILLPERYRVSHREHLARYLENPAGRPMGSGLGLWALRSDGSEFPVEISLSPLQMDGELLTSSFIRDVSDRRELDRALRQDEGRLQSLLEVANVIPWEANAETWKFTYVGPQAVTILGYPSEAWYQPTFWEEHIHPDDRQYAIDLCRKCSQECDDYQFEYRMIAADGGVVWLHDLVSVQSIQGQPKTLSGFMVDITDRKQTQILIEEKERQLRLVTDSLPVLICYIDRDQRYQFNNRAYEEWFGRKAEEYKAKRIREVLGPGYEAARPHVEAALQGERAHLRERLLHQELGWRDIETILVPHTSDAGRVEGIYVLGIDVTDRLQQQEELRKHQEELAHVSRVSTMGEFAASLAHELSQPLGAILTNARAAQEFMGWEKKDLSPAQREVCEALDSIKHDAQRTSEIISRLRALLRKGELRMRPLRVNDLIRAVKTLASGYAQSLDVTLTTHLEPGLPTVSGDLVQLEQVLLNLIRNAVEAVQDLPENQRQLSVHSSLETPATVQVAVCDSGRGPSDETLEHMFEPFFTTKPEGLGMGLSISRSIIEAHGGRLWVRPNPDRGLTAYISLLCRRPEDGNDPS